jgi:hypothetical protein
VARRFVAVFVLKIIVNKAGTSRYAAGVSQTSHNIRYTLRRSSGLAYEKPQSGSSPLWGFSPAHFLLPWKPTVSFIGQQKTSYSFHVRRNTAQKLL